MIFSLLNSLYGLSILIPTIYKKTTLIKEGFQNSIEILDKDRKVIAEKGVKIISGKDIVIDADKMDYDKVLQILNASGNIIVTDSNRNIKINSDKLNYNKKEEKLISSGNVLINLEKRYFLKTQEVIFYKDIGEINIKSPTEINDNFGNFFKIEELKYLINEKLLNEGQ